jgi:hypothetical protein
MKTVTTRTINDRRALDRAGVAEHTGAAYTTVVHWHRHRTRFGFPEGFVHEGTRWFWADDIDTFHAAHREAKLADLTEVDRRGDPRDLVTSGAVARILGYRSYCNLPESLYDHPDHVELMSDGRQRRYWYRQTVWDHADARTGNQSPGRTPGSTTGPRKPHPYADDPRLAVALDLLREADAHGRDRRGLGKQLAEHLGIPERTAQRILAVAAAEEGT